MISPQTRVTSAVALMRRFLRIQEASVNGKVMIPLVAIPAGTLLAGIWLHTHMVATFVKSVMIHGLPNRSGDATRALQRR